MLKLTDLKKQGLSLSKADAQELHSPINDIAQRGNDINVVFEGIGDTAPVKDKPDPLKEYYAELATKNVTLLKENAELKEEIKSVSEILAGVQKVNTDPYSEFEGGDGKDGTEDINETNKAAEKAVKVAKTAKPTTAKTKKAKPVKV